MSGLADRQAELVQALVAGGAPPAGVDVTRLDVARRALLHKRLREVAAHWPVLLSDDATRARFLAWADGRPRTTSHSDGLAFAEHLAAAGLLPVPAAAELGAARPLRRFRRRRHRS